MVDSQIDRNSIQKNVYRSKLLLLGSFYCFAISFFSQSQFLTEPFRSSERDFKDRLDSRK